MRINRVSQPMIKPVSKVTNIQKDKKDKTLLERQLEAHKGRTIDVKR
jgi:hypothetical protein